MDKKTIFRLDDDISFRKCSLFDGCATEHGDCTSFETKEENWRQYYFCRQEGIHFHCSHDPEIEFEEESNEDTGELQLVCPKCKKRIPVESRHNLIEKCLRALNREVFKDAKLVRLDDWYFHEVTKKVKEDDFWVNCDVKRDKDDDTMIVLYVGYKGMRGEKSQFFIKPEKCQLSSDHKDMDPSKVLSRIEVTLKNRKLIQEFENE